MVKFGVNQSVNRVEDDRLVRGAGEYTDDINLPGQLYGYMLRSPIAHGTILSMHVDEARNAPGVVDIITGTELQADNANQRPCMIPLKNTDGSNRADPGHPVLAVDKVCYVGDNLAFIVAETLQQAKDAAELIDVDFDELGVACDTATADQVGQSLVHETVPNNKAFDWSHGKEDELDQIFAKAAHTTTLDLINNPVVQDLVIQDVQPYFYIAKSFDDILT
mgnify:CR=1 FL=1